MGAQTRGPSRSIGRTAFVQVASNGHNEWTLTLRRLKDVAAVRVVWLAAAKTVGVESVRLDYAASSVATTKPGVFALRTAADGDTDVSTLTGLAWSAAQDAAYYSLTVSAHPDLSSPLTDVSGLRASSYSSPRPLPPSTKLYVRVTATNGVGSTTITGSPVSFTTRAPVPGVLVDDFDSYPTNEVLAAAYQRNTGG